MSTADQVQNLFDTMSQHLDAEKAAGLDITVVIALSGEGGGNWTVKVADGKADVAQEAVDNADLTISMDAADYVAMQKGELNAMNAFMQGKIKLQGDMGLAMKFQGLFG